MMFNAFGVGFGVFICAYFMKVIPETCRAHWTIYLCIYWKNTTILYVVNIIFPYKLTIRNSLHTFSNICLKESFVYHSFQQFIKAYRQKCVPYKIEYNMTFHHRIYLVVSVLLIFLLILFVIWIYVSEFRVVMSVTIYALNVQCIFTSSC
jgi:hypothetical protein